MDQEDPDLEDQGALDMDMEGMEDLADSDADQEDSDRHRRRHQEDLLDLHHRHRRRHQEDPLDRHLRQEDTDAPEVVSAMQYLLLQFLPRL